MLRQHSWILFPALLDLEALVSSVEVETPCSRGPCTIREPILRQAYTISNRGLVHPTLSPVPALDLGALVLDHV